MKIRHSSPNKKSWLSLGAISSLFVILFIVSYQQQEDTFILLSWGIFLAYLCLFRSQFVLKYSYLFFLQLSNLLGVFVIENYPNLFLRELDTYSQRFFSLPLLSLFHFIFFFSLYLLEERHSEKEEVSLIEKKDRFELRLSNLVLDGVTVLLVLFFLHVFRQPAFAFNMDRFRYAQVYLTGYKKYLAALPRYFLPFLTIYLMSKKKDNRGVVVICYLIYFVSLFLTGNKFGGFIEALFLLMPYFLWKYQKNLSRVLFSALQIFLIALLTVFLHNTLTSNGSTSNHEYLLQRLAQQGQLWWAMYPQESNNILHLDELSDEYNVWLTGKSEEKEKYHFGIYKIMRKTTPKEIVERKIASGSRYAGATYASLYYYFKNYALLLLPVLAYGMYRITNWYYKSIYQAQTISALVAGYFLLLLHAVYTQADYDVLFGRKTLFIFLMYMIYHWGKFYPKKILFQEEKKQ